MSEYDYLNARVRGMSTQLLPKDFFEAILPVEGVDPLIDALLTTGYGSELTESLELERGVQAVESAMRRNIRSTLSHVLEMAPEEPARLLSVQYVQWDTANILTVVRGLVKDAGADEIMEGVFPAGELDEARLSELAAVQSIREVADTLVTWDVPFAFELRRAILPYAEPPDLVALESSVNEAYFRWAFTRSAGNDPNSRLVRRMLSLQVDLANVKASLDHVRHRSRGEELEDFLQIPGGAISRNSIVRTAGSDSMVEAFEVLEGTEFAPGIEKGILAFGGTGSLGVMERFLEIIVLRAGCRLFRADPLGIAVPLGFIWRKYSEYVNLRILLRGKAYGVPPNTIREELLLE